MGTLQSELKKWEKVNNRKKKHKKKQPTKNSVNKKKKEKLNFVDLMGMNKRGLTRGKGGAWR